MNIQKTFDWIDANLSLPTKEGSYFTYTENDHIYFDSFCVYGEDDKFWVGGNGKVLYWAFIDSLKP